MSYPSLQKIIDSHKARYEPMTFFARIKESADCDYCHDFISSRREILQELCSDGNIEKFCSDTCWYAHYGER